MSDDLSSEYLDGTTTYTWRYANGAVVNSSLYTESNGVFTFTGLVGQTIYAIMTNTGFPGLTLRTTEVTIVATTVALTGITTSTNSPQVGTTITTSFNPPDATVTYQWFRSISLNGTFTAIAGANSDSYMITIDDIGRYL